MKAVEAGMDSVVGVVGPLSEGDDETAADLGDSLVVVFASCRVSIGIWHIVGMIFPMILPLLPLLRLR